MKNRVITSIALCMAGVFLLTSGGTAFASETDSVNTDKLGIAEESIAVDESAPDTVEEPVAQEVIIEEPDNLDWSMEQIEALTGVLTGVEGKNYVPGTAHKYNIHNSVNYDKDIVSGILFSTADIDFNTSGEYGMTYYVYFNREALLNYMNENGIDAGNFPGLTEATTNRVLITIDGKVTISDMTYSGTDYEITDLDALIAYLEENGIDIEQFQTDGALDLDALIAYLEGEGINPENIPGLKKLNNETETANEEEVSEASSEETYYEEDSNEETYTEEDYYEEPSYEEPAYEEPVYEEPSNEESSDTGSSSNGTFIATIYDCDGSGHGYTGVFDEVTGECIEVLDEW